MPPKKTTRCPACNQVLNLNAKAAKARAKSMTKARRHEIAMKASDASKARRELDKMLGLGKYKEKES